MTILNPLPRATVQAKDSHFSAIVVREPVEAKCHGRVAVQKTNSQFRVVGAGELVQAKCQGRAAVVIKPVSADSLRKTGICADKAGDFRQFPPQDRRTGSPETKPNTRKAGISGPFPRLPGSLAKRRTDWLRREDSNLEMLS